MCEENKYAKYTMKILKVYLENFHNHVKKTKNDSNHRKYFQSFIPNFYK